MLQVNLSTLKLPELRRLLDATRSRGEAAMSYQILQEMAARREGRGGLGLARLRRPAEPRMIAVDMGDPMDRQDELPPLPARRAPAPESEASASPAATPKPEAEPVATPRRSRRRKTQPLPTASPAAAAPVAEVDVEPTPPPLPEPKRLRSVWHDDPEPPKDEAASSKGRGLSRFRGPGLESPAPSTLHGGAGAIFAVGIAVGGALGWWVGATTRETPSPVARTVLPIQVAALTPPPTPATRRIAEPEPAPETPPEPAIEAPPPELREGAVLSADAAEVARDATGEAMELPAPSPQHRKAEVITAVARTAPAGANACPAAPTPADRQICVDPDLRRLQRELRRAYAQALEAHEDRALLRQRQLAWRDARNTVSEPGRLARLYEQRIRKLNAATAEARQQR